MKKSWADHCSSDEESLDNFDFDDLDDSTDQLGLVDAPHEEDLISPPEEPLPLEMVYNLPDRPPYTAFVGNLNFSLKEPEQLKVAIIDAVSKQQGKQLDVVEARIATDRRDGKHRGFGYVEVATLEDVS